MFDFFKKKDDKDRTLVWAHRGASGYAPENSLRAFELAAEQGADGVELDVQLTKDVVMVVTHDEKINRVSDREGFVKDYTFEELREMNFNAGKKKFGKVLIPTLEEVYKLLKPSGLTINVEIKSGVFFYEGIEEKCLALTKEYGMEDRVLYSSFNHATVKKMKELDPTVKTGLLYADGILDVAKYAKTMTNCDALHPALYNIQYPDFFKEAKEQGLDVNVWTVNEEEYMHMCVDAGVNAIITNYPDKALKIARK
jgi:glycerophosphoryl diester phosphodiesterase